MAATTNFGLLSDPCFEEHNTGAGHPERHERLQGVRQALDDAAWGKGFVRVAAQPATDAQLELVHDAAYIRRVAAACGSGARHIDSMDVAVCPESERIARLASGGLVALCDAVLEGRIQRGFAAVRPPGHHAERDLAMGFCLYNHVAVAARHLIRHHGLERVMVIDWDVHHGNGTQHIFEDDPAVFYYSSHQHPLYPGTGLASERGVGAGEGTTLNCPLAPGAGNEAFLGALTDQLVPAAKKFQPQFVLISAGFDAHHSDPLANLSVDTEAFRSATEVVMGIADTHADGRLVSTLEGGYDLEALTASTLLHVRTLSGA